MRGTSVLNGRCRSDIHSPLVTEDGGHSQVYKEEENAEEYEERTSRPLNEEESCKSCKSTQASAQRFSSGNKRREPDPKLGAGIGEDGELVGSDLLSIIARFPSMSGKFSTSAAAVQALGSYSKARPRSSLSGFRRLSASNPLCWVPERPPPAAASYYETTARLFMNNDNKFSA